MRHCEKYGASTLYQGAVVAQWIARSTGSPMVVGPVSHRSQLENLNASGQ